MAKKVYTIDVKDENVAETKAKRTRTVKSKTEKEVESLGVAEINNASATKRVRNKADKGFEKNVVGTTKRAVKQKVNEVEDYFDFSFKRTESASVDVCEAKAKTEKINLVKEVCMQECGDADAYVIVNLARMGSLFGCDKRAINA